MRLVLFPAADRPERVHGRARIWPLLLLASLLVGAGLGAFYIHEWNESDDEVGAIGFRYDVEYPFIGYSTKRPAGRIARLVQRLANGGAALEFDAASGYVAALLRELDIDPSSQLLVFSKTSLQSGLVSPEMPRAIYFNDDTYVAFIPGAESFEVASMDPDLGPTFFAVEQRAGDGFPLERQLNHCLRCHDSYSLTGGGVPRFILGSGYIDTRGELVSHEAWILTDQSTPLRNRWGGWYVSGQHGDVQHLGNLIVSDASELSNLDELRVGNLDDLQALLDTSRYLTPYSDIVALLVIEHQIDVQNALTRVNYAVRALIHEAAAGSAPPPERLREIVEPLVDALLCVGEAALTDTVRGTSGFGERFQARGIRDSKGRSLRDLDLTTRLFRYPMSYLVYSEAFEALPDAAKEAIYDRLAEVLRGSDRSEAFSHLSADDREAIFEILRDTKPDFASAIAD